MHGWVHNLQELSIEILLWVWTRGVNYDSIQIVEIGIAQARLGQLGIGSESLRLCCLRSLLLILLLGTSTHANIRRWLLADKTLIGVGFLRFILRALGSTAARLLLLLHLGGGLRFALC